MELSWQPALERDDGPLFMALVRALSSDIANGKLHKGSRLPSQRELADQLKIAIGTVTRAFNEAERRGLIYGDGRRGTFVGELPRGRGFLVTSGKAGSMGIDLSKNHPSHALDPELGPVLRRIISRKNYRHLLQYPPAAGFQAHREAGARWLQTLGFETTPASLFTSSGAQHALLAIMSAETHPGDLIAVEEYTYPGVKAIAETIGLELIGIPMDREGIIPEELESVCRRRQIRLLYCNPVLQNPTNRVFSSARLKQIAEIARQYGLIIIEDQILVPFLEKPPEYLAHLAPESSYFVVSVSKAVAAGLRLGFVIAPSNARQKLIDALQTTNLGNPPLMAEIFAQWLEDGTVAQTIARRRQELAAVNQIACEMLNDFQIQAHPASYHVWLTLPEKLTSAKFAAEAQSRGVMISPAEIFAVGKKSPLNAVRLSIGAISSREQLRRGLHILAEILTDTAPRHSVTV